MKLSEKEIKELLRIEDKYFDIVKIIENYFKSNPADSYYKLKEINEVIRRVYIC